MRSTKLRRKILAGILCAAMVFQSVPAGAAVSQAAETAQSYDSGENDTTEEELREDKAGTDSGSALPEDVANNSSSDSQATNETPVGNETDASAVSETLDTTETPVVSETSDTTETPVVNETSDTLETPVVSETPDTTETSDAAESGESTDMAGTEENVTEAFEEENTSTDEDATEEVEGIMLFAEEWPDFKKLLSVVSEKKYYFYDKAEEIFVKLEGCEIPDNGISIEFYIDDEDTPEKCEKREDYYVIPLLEKKISEGSHRLTVKLIDDADKSELVSRENIGFTIEKVDNVFAEVDKYYISSTDDTIEVAFFNPADDIESVKITAPNGDIVARSGERSLSEPQTEDPRYVGIGYGYVYQEKDADDKLIPVPILYKTTWVMPTEKNALDVGNYDIRLTLKDGTERMIPHAVEVSSRAVVTKCTLGTDYDNTDGVVYLYIQGTGFNPSQVRFDFEDMATSAILSTTRLDYKTVQSGYIVKFRKEGNWDKAGKEIKVSISSKNSGNIDFSQKNFVAQLESGIYYAEYNPVLNAVEVGVTTDLNGKAVKFSIVDDKDNPTKIIGVTSRSLTESLAYLTPSVSEEKLQGEYYVQLEASGNKYYKKIYINQETSAANYWDAPKVISKNAERHDFYYYSDIAGISNNGLKASIDGYGGDVAVYASEWLREDNAKGTSIQVWIPTFKLSLGQHIVRITRDGSEFSSYAFEVVASDYDKFVLDKYSLSWIDDDTIQLYMKTSNCSEEDDYDIRLMGVNDREPAEISAVVTDRYADSIFMSITGLKKSDAFKDYYVLITHKKYGLPVKMENLNEKFYEDEDKGKKISISSNKGLPVLSNNRVIGINIQNMALPATLTIYETETTTVIKKITIPSTVVGNYYYFTKDFYDSFINKDRLYDMTISDFGDNWGRSYARINIGYKDETVVNDIDVQITSDTLYIDGAESGRSAIITVTGNTQNPVFEVSDDEIVTLEDYIETSEDTGAQILNPNKRRVVSKNTGATFITVIADGVKKSIFVTVTRSASGITLNTSNRNMKVGDSFEAEAYILPKSAEDPTQIVNFTSSDNHVLYVRKLTNTTAKVTALKAGTAVLRATLEGTTYTVAVTVTITDSFPLYDKKEIKIKEVGTVPYIENVDRDLSYCGLPKGWEWKEKDISLTAGEKLQYCWATYTEEGYQPFDARLPVAVTRIVGIDITGKKLINQGQKESYHITYEYIGADIDSPKFRERINVGCIRTSGDNVADIEDGTLAWDSLVVAAPKNTGGGTADFALTLSIDNGTSEGVDLFTKEFSVIVPLKDCVNNVKIRPLKAAGQKFDYKENENRMEVDVTDVKKAKNKYSVALQAEPTINGVPAKNIKFKWSSSDSAIASVGENDKGEVILTIKKAGYVEITAVADDAGECAGVLAVDIMDYSPVLETTSVTVNKYSTSGAAIILQEQNGNEILSVRILEGEVDSGNFSASRPTEGISKLVIKANAPALGFVKKTVSNCKLEAWTAKGTYQYDLKVTTDVAKPSATLKLKTKANLFYTDAEAVYTISSKYDILSIEDVGEAETVRFYGEYDRSSNTVRFNTKGTLDSSTLSQFTVSKSPCLNMKLKVTFAGFSEPQTMEVKVATENKKPSLSMTGLTTCPGISSGTVKLVDSKTKLPISVDDTSMSFQITKPANNTVGIEINKKGIVSVIYSGVKNVSYTAMVTNKEWTQPINVNGKITYVKSPDKMALALGSKQLTLNMGTNIKANGVNVIPVFVNGSDIAISSLTHDGTAEKLIDAGYLAYEFDAKDQNISLGLNEGKRGDVKAGSYKFNLSATVNIFDAPVVIKKATLTIKLTEIGAAKVTLSSPKGKINLIDRANTSVVYTPKISGIDTSIKSVSVAGDTAEYFTAFLNKDNKVEIKANAGKSMSVEPYDVAIMFTMQNNYLLPAVVRIKPANTLPKIAFTPAKCNLYRSNSNKYTVAMSLKNSTVSLDKITSIKIDTGTNKNANNFSLINNISKDGTVSFSLAGDKSRIKKGKYTVKCLVTFRDAAVNSKPGTVNMVITVK